MKSFSSDSMRWSLLAFWLVASLSVGATVGCRKTKTEQSYDVMPDVIKSVDLPPAKFMEIEFETTDGTPITAALVKTTDADLALKAVESGKSPEQAVRSAKNLAMQEGPRGKITTPTSKERVNFSVLIFSRKPTRVTIRTLTK
jgi:hypothetical protein